jgi:predicted nucleic acid-binding protein
VNRLLLDASVLLAAFDPDDANHEAARALLEDGEVALTTLDLARYEVTNVAVRAWRTPELVEPLLAAIERLGEDGGVLRSDSALLARAAELAERHEISAYDAAYVAAGSDTGLPLVSCDERDLVSRGLASLPADARSQS